jgi:NAD(P)H-hydrate epimerase
LISIASMTREELRDYDARAIAGGIPGIVLMESAGRGATDLLVQQGITGSVGVVVGRGNNGGDGFVIARHLVDRGYRAHIELLFEPKALRGDALLAYQGASYLDVPIKSFDPVRSAERLAECEWIVDAILGTGAVGDPKPPVDEAIRIINRTGKKILAVDLPSGLDANTGWANEPTVRATWTASFVAPKRGFETATSTTWTGPVHVVSIGAGPPRHDRLVT